MPKPGEHKTVQSRILKDAQEIGWTFVPRVEAESRRGFNPDGGSPSERVSANYISLAYVFVPLDFKPLNPVFCSVTAQTPTGKEFFLWNLSA